MSPFENNLIAFDLPGQRLKEALELSVSSMDLNKGINSSYVFLQVSGLRITYDLKRPVNERVVDLKVRCSDCRRPKYEDFSNTKTYRLVTPEFIQKGGNGYTMFRDYGTNLRYTNFSIQNLSRLGID